MGITNFRLALEKRYASLTGQLQEVRRTIARIEREVEKLPGLEARIPKLEALIESAAMLLEDVDPAWQRSETRPTKPFTHLLPVPFGSCSRRALEVLRLADKPMTAREIAVEVLRQSGSEATDRKIIERTTNTILASLRKHAGRSVESSGKYPAQWRSIVNPDVEFDI